MMSDILAIERALVASTGAQHNSTLRSQALSWDTLSWKSTP